MLIFRKEAEEDIREAYEWYEEKSSNLGIDFVSEVETIFAIIEENPEICAKVFDNVRRMLCKRFPYSVYYLESKSIIVVIAVLHQKRNPEIWQERA